MAICFEQVKIMCYPCSTALYLLTENPMPTPSSLSYAPRHDTRKLRSLITKLTLGAKVFALVVSVAVIFLWWLAARWLLNFGHHLDFSGLDALGEELLTYLERYNPFFWWAVVLIGSCIVLYALSQFVWRLHTQSLQRFVQEGDLTTLISQLHPNSIQVLDWCWEDRRNPITVGVLQRTASELSSGRVAKLDLVTRQQALLQPSLTASEAATAADSSLHSVEFRV